MNLQQIKKYKKRLLPEALKRHVSNLCVFGSVARGEATKTSDTLKDNVTNELAVEKLITIIGETTNHLSDRIKKDHKNIDWINIVGMRNKLIHEYSKVHNNILWNVAKNALPKLKKRIKKIISKRKGGWLTSCN